MKSSHVVYNVYVTLFMQSKKSLIFELIKNSNYLLHNNISTFNTIYRSEYLLIIYCDSHVHFKECIFSKKIKLKFDNILIII